jgi:hypothetical protein
MTSLHLKIVAIAALSLAPLSADAGYVPIQPTIQEYPEWCWAASLLTVLNGFTKYPGYDLEVSSSGYKGQCLIAQKLSPGDDIDCCDDQDSCFFGAYDGEMSDVLNGYPYNLHTSNNTSTISGSELNNYINVWNLPVIITVQFMYDPWSHAVVVTGYNSTNSVVTLMDPSDGYFMEVPISDLINGTSSFFPYKWIETILWNKTSGVPSDTMSLNQKLIYSKVSAATDVNKSYMFVSEQETTVGPSFRLDRGARFGIMSRDSEPIILKKGTTINSGAKFCAKYGGNCAIP